VKFLVRAESLFARFKVPRDAWIIWAIFFFVIAVIVVLQEHHTVTPVYREASSLWFAGEDLYDGSIGGFLYLPQASMLYAPFAWLPFRVGEVFWRAFTIGILAYAVWRIAHLTPEMGKSGFFLVMTLLVIPSAMSSARNGQMNLPLAAALTCGAVELARRQWWKSAFWLILGFAFKPMAFVMILLTGALYGPMRWRLVLGLAVLAAVPFLAQDPAYVLGQYKLFIQKMQVAGNPGANTSWSDFFGLAHSLGIKVSHEVRTLSRVAAAGLTLVLCWFGLRRCDHPGGAILLYSFSACFLMLFNPRTENTTYVVLGVPMALFAAKEFLAEHKVLNGAAIALLILAMSASYGITRGSNHWITPGTCLVFFSYITYLLLSNRQSVLLRESVHCVRSTGNRTEG
jgi:hypothetical protein